MRGALPLRRPQQFVAPDAQEFPVDRGGAIDVGQPMLRGFGGGASSAFSCGGRCEVGVRCSWCSLLVVGVVFVAAWLVVVAILVAISVAV